MRARVTDWLNPCYTEIYRERTARARLLRSSSYHLAAYLKHYAANPIDFIEDWGVTYDPRRLAQGRPVFIPLILFERQQEFVRWVLELDRERKPGVCEKSREVGISWLIAAIMVWSWLFRPGSSIGYGSYHQKKVDDLGSLDSQLEKCRLFIGYLPDFLKPIGFNPDRHLLHERFVNPENRATILGQVGDEIGRGSRATLYFIDEAAHLAHPDRVDAAISQTTEARIYASSANGPGSFYKKVKGGAYSVFRFHWRDDPRKNEAWYAEQKRILLPHIVAQEVDIDHTTSVEDIAIPARWVEAARQIRPLLEAAGEALEFGGAIAGLDVKGTGSALNVCVVRRGPVVEPPEGWENPNTTTAAHRAIELAKAAQARVIHFDPIGVGHGVLSEFENLEAEITESIPSSQLGDEIERMVNRAAGALDPSSRTRREAIRAAGINVGVKSWDGDDRTYKDGKTARQRFANLKAMIWDEARDRLEKTHETYLALTGAEGGVRHPIEELLILPDHDELCSQLSTPKRGTVGAGKIALESKEALRRRGVASPDYADALMLTFAPTPATLEVGELEGYY